MSLLQPMSSPERRYPNEERADGEAIPFLRLVESSNDIVYSVDQNLKVISVSPSLERALGYRCDEVVGTDASDLQFISPESVKKWLSDISRMMKGEAVTENNYLFVARDGTPRVAKVSGTPMIQRGEIVGVTCVAKDHTGGYFAKEALSRQQKTAVRPLEEAAILAKIGQLISSSLHIDELYEHFAAELRKIIPFDRFSINLRNIDDDTVGVACAFGSDIPERMRGDSFPLSGTLTGAVMVTRTGLLLNPQNDDEVIARFLAFSPTFKAGMRSMISVPLISREEAIGALHLRSKTPNFYTERDFRLAETIGAQIAGAIASAQLSTSLKKAEASLRESEVRLRVLFEQETVGVAEIDTDTGRFQSVALLVCKMLGRTENELLNTSYHSIMHPEERRRHAEKLQQLLAGEIGYYSMDQRCLRKDGAVIWVTISVSSLGMPGRITAVFQDITEQKRAEEENGRLSRQLAMLYETGVDITSGLNLEQLLVSIAQRALALIGGTRCSFYLYEPKADRLEQVISAGPALIPGSGSYRRGEGIVGQVWATNAPMLNNDYRTWTDQAQPHDSSPFRSVVAVPFHHKTEIMGVIDITANFPHRYIQADLDLLSLFATQAAISIHNARLCDLIGRDLEERRRIEEERKAIQAQLLQSQKMEAIGTLAGGIAHDFNNILMGIQGYISLIQMDLPSKHPHFCLLQGIEEQIGSGASLTTQLLGFAREGRYEARPTNLNTVLMNSYEIFSRTHREISVSRSLQEGLWPAEVDRKQIEQILLNLFINSWQAMPEGGDLYLETQNAVLSVPETKPFGVQPGKYVKISVTDTGTGMDESTKARIFEPFFTTKRPGKGTGLGLASVYGIMDNHGGFITVNSELGKGSTFALYLPASEKEVMIDEKPVEKSILTGTGTILVVDDEKSNVIVMKEILESYGYRVLLAGSGQEAVAVYMEKGKEIDLVILDMIMPGMGGGKVFDALRTINPAVKVILASGYSKDGEARQILDRGCSGFVQKPFRIASIAGMIREAIGK